MSLPLGIFAKTFVRPTVEETLDAVRDAGLTHVQFNLSIVGLPTLPEAIDPALCDRIAAACAGRGLTMAAISGTYNMIHPEHDRRRDGLNRLRVLARACERLGTSVITLCSGTRDRDDMWRAHPSNTSWAAWEDLVDAMGAAQTIAADHGMVVAFEPELANVVDSPAEAVRLIERLGGPQPHLKVVIDPANIFPAGSLSRMDQILDEAVELLGPHLALAHAKDLHRDGAAGDAAAGTGKLDFPRYLAGLKRVGYHGPLILHGLTEDQVPTSVAYLRGVLAGI